MELRKRTTPLKFTLTRMSYSVQIYLDYIKTKNLKRKTKKHNLKLGNESISQFAN